MTSKPIHNPQGVASLRLVVAPSPNRNRVRPTAAASPVSNHRTVLVFCTLFMDQSSSGSGGPASFRRRLMIQLMPSMAPPIPTKA